MNLNIIKNYFEPFCLLDIGANTGQFCQLWKSFFPDCYVYSIEANKDCEEHLKKINPNYKICLLHSKKDKVEFYKNKNDLISTGNSTFRELTHFFNDESLIVENIETQTLDDVCDNLNFCFDFIKIDTQGSELEILKGAENTLKTIKGIILEVSHIPYNQNAPLTEEVFSFMKKIGYERKDTLWDSYHNGELFQSDILFIKK